MKLEVRPVKISRGVLFFTISLLAIGLSCAPQEKKKKIDIYQAPQQEHPVLVMGFHSIGGDKTKVWQNFALSYFVSEDLRLTVAGKIWLDPIVLRGYFPAFETRLFSKMPENEDLVYMCNLFRCDDGFYVVWEDLPGGIREYRVFPFSKEDVKPPARKSLPADDLIAAQQFISRTVLGALNLHSEAEDGGSKGFIPRNTTAMRLATMGFYFSDVGWYNKALEFFKEALGADPDYKYASLKVGEVLLAKDEAGEALKYLTVVRAQFSADPFYLYLLARTYFYAGNMAEAEKAIDECLRIAPHYQEATMLQAILKGGVGKKAAQREAVGRFLQSNPKTGAQLARSEKYLQGFSRSPEVAVLSNKLAPLQVYDPYFGELPSALFGRMKSSGEWILGRLQRDIRRPGEIILAPQGLIVWDQTARAVLLISQDGITKKEFTYPGFIEPDGLAFNPPDQVYLADPLAGTVFSLDLSSGRATAVNKDIPRPRGVAVLSDHIYVTDAVTDVIWVLDRKGNVFKQISIPKRGLNKEASPRHIISTPRGTLLYEDDLLNRIIEISPDGKVLRSIASYGFGPDEIVEPVGLALAPDGRIFVTDWGDHRVKVFNPDGTIYAVFGGYGTLAGQFNRPTGVAFLPDGRILVTDRENGRIQIFRYQHEK